MDSICIPRRLQEENKLKKKIVVFGVGRNFCNLAETISILFDIVAITDNDSSTWKHKIGGYEVSSPQNALSLNYDEVLVTPKGNKGIIEQLLDLGVKRSDIITINEIFQRAYEGTRLKIGLIFYGGIGDFLIGCNWLCHLADRYRLDEKSADIYVYRESLASAKTVFEKCRYVDHITGTKIEFDTLQDTRKYDLVIRFCILPFVQYYNAWKLKAINPEMLKYALNVEKFGLENYNFGFCHSGFFYTTIRHEFERSSQKNYYSFCDITGDLGIDEHSQIPFSINIDEKKFLKKSGIGENKFITLDTGLNTNYTLAHNTRAWSHDKWNNLAKVIKANCNGYLVVQVGAKMSDDDNIIADIHLNGVTSVEEAKVLMKNAAVHVDYDGGLVHIRHILGGGPSVVLFGPTDINQHKYTENICLRKNICEKACEWTTENWLFDCPKGFCSPKCMDAIDVDEVFEAVIQCLNKR